MRSREGPSREAVESRTMETSGARPTLTGWHNKRMDLDVSRIAAPGFRARYFCWKKCMKVRRRKSARALELRDLRSSMPLTDDVQLPIHLFRGISLRFLESFVYLFFFLLPLFVSTRSQTAQFPTLNNEK